MRGTGAAVVLALATLLPGGCSRSGEAEELGARFESELPVPPSVSLDHYHRHYALLTRDEAYRYTGLKLAAGHNYLVGLYRHDGEPGLTAHGDWTDLPRPDNACINIVAIDNAGDFATDPKWECEAPPTPTVQMPSGKPT